MSETTHRRLFGWSEFLDIMIRPLPDDMEYIAHSVSSTPSPERDMNTGYDEALRLAQEGWPEGLERLEREHARLVALFPAGNDISARYDESGDEADIGRMLDFDPECMLEYVLQPSRKPVVRIIASISASAVIDADALFHKGAAVALAVDGLESSGIQVEVVADRSFTGDPDTYRPQIMVKEAGEPMDLGRIAFTLCHPAMLRRLCFRLSEFEGRSKWRKQGAGGYGIPVDPEPEPESCVIPCARYMDPRWNSPENAAKAAKEIIAELGGQV